MRKSYWLILFIITIFIFGQKGLCFAGEVRQPGDYTSKLTFKGLERTYQLHIPTNYNQKVPSTLVIVCHGGGMTAEEMKETTQFNSLSDEKGFIVIYPDAVEKGWNDDRKTTMERRSLRENIDDVGYISILIDTLKSEWNIDNQLVFITGMSNGGMFSQRVARELSGKVAGFASVVAPAPETRTPGATPSRPVPAMFILGANDPVIQWTGGDLNWGKSTIGRGLPIPFMINYWVNNNKAIKEIRISNENSINYNVLVRHEVYNPSLGGAPVEVYIVNNNGHQWPGGTKSLPESVAGKTNSEFNATKAIWNFFESIK
ncbi:MAG: phospholipase [Anaerosporomusa subterranea]|nr:phospholipase [Anaerosporomusa subterranea]